MARPRLGARVAPNLLPRGRLIPARLDRWIGIRAGHPVPSRW